jgi:hypothetical protein
VIQNGSTNEGGRQEKIAWTKIVLMTSDVFATVWKMQGSDSLHTQVRKINDRMIADDASTCLHGRQVQQMLHELRELLRNQP